MKKYLKISFIFLLGIMTGAGGVFLWLMPQLDNQKKLEALFVVSSELEEANRVYRESDPKLAIYALQRALEIMEICKQTSLFNKDRSVSWDKGLLNARIGRMYQKAGDEKSAYGYFQKAIEHFSKVGWILDNSQELNKAVDLIDENQIENAIKNYGRIEK